MVLYFTGTGNSRHIAERIAHALGDEPRQPERPHQSGRYDAACGQ